MAAAKTDAAEDAVVKLEIPPYEHFADEARVLSAAEGHGYTGLLNRNEGPSVLSGRGRPDYREGHVAVRSRLGEETFGEAWSEGRATPPERAASTP